MSVTRKVDFFPEARSSTLTDALRAHLQAQLSLLIAKAAALDELVCSSEWEEMSPADERTRNAQCHEISLRQKNLWASCGSGSLPST